jgi:hypothetical protein
MSGGRFVAPTPDAGFLRLIFYTTFAEVILFQEVTILKTA